MAQSNFFPSRPDLTPQIYAYSDPRYEGMLKVGYTTRDVQKLWGIPHMAQMAGSWKQTGKEPPRADEIRKLMQ